jgi:hypothetical protein
MAQSADMTVTSVIIDKNVSVYQSSSVSFPHHESASLMEVHAMSSLVMTCTFYFLDYVLSTCTKLLTIRSVTLR